MKPIREHFINDHIMYRFVKHKYSNKIEQFVWVGFEMYIRHVMKEHIKNPICQSLKDKFGISA